MVCEPEQHADEDRKRRDLIEARNIADTLSYTAAKTLRELEHPYDAPIREEVEAKVTEVRDALNTEDVDRIKRSTDELSAAMQQIGQAMYAKQQADAGTRGPGMDGTGDMGDIGGNGATEPGTAKEA